MLSTLNLASTRGVTRDFALGNRQGRNAYKYQAGVRAGALALPSISEDAPAHHGHDKVKALTSGCGFVIGDVLAQSITGGQLDALRSVQLGVVGSVLDVFRQEAAKEDSKVGRAAASTAAAAQEVKNNLVWAPIVTCAIYAALKMVEGNPQEIVQGVEDKLVTLMVANHVLWPVTRFLNDKFVPAQHRQVGNHIITVVWNAWLSTLGHAPQIDAGDLLSKFGGESAMQHVAAAAAPVMQHASEAVSPFVSHAAQGVAALAERMPSCLLEKAFSKSLDVLSPLASVERSPSQLLEAAASLDLQRAGTLELVLDRLHSTRL